MDAELWSPPSWPMVVPPETWSETAPVISKFAPPTILA